MDGRKNARQQQFLNSSFTIPVERDSGLEEIIKKNCVTLTYPPKTTFLECGEEMDGVYYLRSGRSKHYILGEDGAEKILYTLSAGWFFGETPNILHEPTGLISETMETTEIWKIAYRPYLALLDANKTFRDAIMSCMARKMLIMRHEIENLVFNPCKQRIMQLLCSTVDTTSIDEEKWYNLRIHYTHYEVSTIVGSARVTTSKLINELCAEGFLRILNHKMQVSRQAYEQIAKDCPGDS
jgi:CRP/FNR family cyclic AMP-dependent transcriptional regulator